MKTIYVLGLVSVLGLAGCAHSTMRGSVAMKGDDQEAHVCMGDKEVKAGDRVILYKNVCTPRGSGGARGDRGPIDVCKKVRLGEGEVLRTLNEHYSLVKVDPGVPFEEGTVVEKK